MHVNGRWLLVAVVVACGPSARPVSLDAPKCTASRAAIEKDIAEGQLLRSQRRLAIEAARCKADPWIEETSGEVARTLESNGSPEAALVALERAENARAIAEPSARDPNVGDAPKYSSGGRYVLLGSNIVDVQARRVVARRERDGAVEFAPDDRAVGIADEHALRIVALPSGEEVARDDGHAKFLSWSDDSAWLAWAGDHPGWAEMASKRVHAMTVAVSSVPSVARGVIAATVNDSVIVKRLANDELVATLKPVDAYAIDSKRDRLLFLETPKGPLRALDLATRKITQLAWKPPHYRGVCGADVDWGLVGLDGDAMRLTRNCSGGDLAVLDLKTGRATFSTILDGADMIMPAQEWGHDDKSAWQDIGDVDFDTFDRVVRSPKRDTFAGFDRSGRARVWTKDGKVVWAGPARPEQVLALAITPDGSELVTFSHAYDLRRWNVRTGELVSTRTFPRDCELRDLVVRDDGEAVFACAPDGETDRVYRERSKEPVLERKHRDALEKATLDRLGAFVVFSTLAKPPVVVPLERNAKPVERAFPDPSRSLAAVAGDAIVLVARNGERALYRWSTGAQLAAVPGDRAWAAFAGRGAWLAVERASAIDVWSVKEPATLAFSLTKPPAAPSSFALAGRQGPAMARGILDFVTWPSASTSPTQLRASGACKSVDYDAPRNAFALAEATGAELRAVSGERSLVVLAVPHANTFVTIDAIAHTVVRGGERERADDLLVCRIGTRTLPYAVCAGRFDPL